MAKLILKVNYYKPGRSKSMGGYAKYIATRENVEKNEDKVLHLKSTESQQELIEKLLRDFPESIHSEEYQAYCSDGTREKASEYITRTLEDNIPQIIDSPTYADYIATRPRAERIGSHGLFSSGDEPIVLSKVSEELNEHAGNVWVFIASLKREDAERLGYDHASRWKDMIGSQVTKIASAMNIPPEHLKWYAAFHNEGHHPHVHIMVYSTDPREGFINEYGIEKICLLNLYRTMERRMSGNAHVRCEAGENPEITSKDYLSLFPKIESAEMMFSASRSRRVSIVPIIQSLAQLEKNYGKEGAEIIVDNTQLTVFGGFAPNSETAQVLSKSLGTKTVMSGSVSQSKNDPSRSLQMIERPLMTAEELKALPKGTFIVTKTGFNPIRVKLKLFFEWGIQFEKEPFVVPLRDNKDVCYADRDTLMRLVYEKYASKQKKDEDEIPPSSISVEQVLSEQNNPPSDRPHDIPEGAKLHNAPRPEELP